MSHLWHIRFENQILLAKDIVLVQYHYGKNLNIVQLELVVRLPLFASWFRFIIMSFYRGHYIIYIIHLEVSVKMLKIGRF